MTKRLSALRRLRAVDAALFEAKFGRGRFGDKDHLPIERLEPRRLLSGVSFDPAMEYATGLNPSSVTAGDFNIDSKMDLAVANYNSNTVSVFLNNGDGTFINKLDFSAGSHPSSIISADINADGKPDLAVTNYDDNSVSVLLNNGVGSFVLQTTHIAGGSGGYLVSMTSADFNTDGKPDLAVANYSNNVINVLLGNGDGTFIRSNYTTGIHPFSVTSADFNADGKPDLASANSDSNTVSVLMNTGNGHFAAKVDYLSGSKPISLTSADFNSDSKADIAVVNQSGDTISLLRNNDNGTFADRVDYPSGMALYSITTADFSGDGKPDLVVDNWTFDSINVLRNSGDGVFSAYDSYATGDGPCSITSADFNGDAKPDLAVANKNGNTISVLLNNLIKAPSDISITTSSVNENQASGALVGMLSTTDPYSSGLFTYALVSGTGSTDNASFTLSGNSLLTNASFDYEAKNSYIIRVRSTDESGLFFEKSLTISITNVNEAPVDIVLSPNSIAENQPLGTMVGTLSTTDPDAGNIFTYALVSGDGSDDNYWFTLIGNSLTANASFDAETRSSYHIRVQSTDNVGLFLDKSLTITIANVNEAPLGITLSPNAIAENLPSGTTVGALATLDPDAGDTFIYSLVSGPWSADNALFTIVGNTLKTASSFNYETQNYCYINVRATDAGGLYVEWPLGIAITNVNEAPVNISLTASSIAENLPSGVAIGYLTTTDPDAGISFTYSLVSGSGSADNASFTLVGNALKTASSFNYEVKNSYSIRVRSTDQGGLAFEKTFTIAVTNANEPPTNITLSANSVAENQPSGTVVGTLSAIDPDAGNTFIYDLVSGSGGSDNAFFNIVGNTLKTNASFDFETKNSYSIRVQTVDQGEAWFEKVFTVTVTNVNEPPSNITLSPNSVAELQPSGTVVGMLSALDPENDTTFSYALVNGEGSADNAMFTLVGNSLQTKAIFDFETRNSYSIRVRATDPGLLWFDKVLTVSVNNVNEPPSDIALSLGTVAFGAPAGTPVDTFTAADPDGLGGFTYSLVAGVGDAALFTLVNDTLQTAAPIDRLPGSSYWVRARVTEAGGLWFERNLTLTVQEITKTYYVDASVLGGSQTGDSWLDASKDLQTIMDKAMYGACIRVADGVYKPTLGTDRTASFVLKNGIRLIGGYAGYGSDQNARDVAAYPSILSGNIGTASNTDNSYHVVVTSDAQAATVIDGFTITAGCATGSYYNGGGMYNSVGSPTIVNCTFTGNSATNGGGIYNSGGSPAFVNCKFKGNVATDGGGMFNYGGSPTITNCIFSGNEADGYGWYILDSNQYIESGGRGGGMCNFSSTPTVTNSTFLGNSTFYQMDVELYCSLGASSEMAISASANNPMNGIPNNAETGGGGMYNEGGSPTIANCDFIGNSTTLTGNFNSDLFVIAGGGGINNLNSSSIVANCILWGNAAVQGAQIYGGIASYCDIQGGFGATGNINLDPRFVRFPSAGADGTWGTADDDVGDLNLLLGSPCIDAGNNAAVPTGITTDQGGGKRFFDIPSKPDTGFGTPPIVDMGVFELRPSDYVNAPTIPDLADASDSGVFNNDNITNINQPTFIGLSDPGTTVTIFCDNVAVGQAAAVGGSYSITTSALAEGPHQITAKATSAAGFVSLPSGSITVTIDRIKPSAPSIPDLDSSSDSGIYKNDNITSVYNPLFTGTAEPGSFVIILCDSLAVGQAAAGGDGNYRVITSSILSEGVHLMTAKATDAAGNVSLVSGGLNITIDRTATAAPAMPDLAADNDSGVSNADNLTNINTPTFTGTAAAGSYVTLYSDGFAVGQGVASGGNYSIKTSVLGNGTHLIAASATDVVGNASPLSSGLNIIIDTVRPATPTIPDLAAASDSGRSNIDNITNINAPIFTGTAEAGSTVTLYSDNVTIGQIASGDGSYSITAGFLSNGAHNIKASCADLAGNVSLISGGLSISIDTVKPIAPTIPDMTPGSDTGASNTDNITSINTPTFTGTVETNSTATLFSDGLDVGLMIAVDGNYSIASTVLSNGVHLMSAMATDVAGNVSLRSGDLRVTINTVPPVPGPLPDMTSASDTGLSNTDNITKINTPTFTGTAETGNTVTIFSDGLTVGIGVASNGNYSITTSVLGNGVHLITASVTNPAGLVTPVPGSLSITIDQIAPAAPAAPVLQPSSDTGVKGDGITANQTLTFNVSGAPYFQFYRNSVSISQWENSACYTTPTQSYGTASYRITAMDLAGNSSPPGAVVTVRIDAPPVAQAGADLTVIQGQTANLSAAGSSDPEGDSLTYQWNFGYTNAPMGFGRDATHVFTQAGTYTVTLTAVDAHEASANDSVQVTVIPPPSVINLAPLGILAVGSSYFSMNTETGRYEAKSISGRPSVQIGRIYGSQFMPMVQIAGEFSYNPSSDIKVNGTIRILFQDRDLLNGSFTLTKGSYGLFNTSATVSQVSTMPEMVPLTNKDMSTADFQIQRMMISDPSYRLDQVKPTFNSINFNDPDGGAPANSQLEMGLDSLTMPASMGGFTETKNISAHKLIFASSGITVSGDPILLSHQGFTFSPGDLIDLKAKSLSMQFMGDRWVFSGNVSIPALFDKTISCSANGILGPRLELVPESTHFNFQTKQAETIGGGIRMVGSQSTSAISLGPWSMGDVIVTINTDTGTAGATCEFSLPSFSGTFGGTVMFIGNQIDYVRVYGQDLRIQLGVLPLYITSMDGELYNLTTTSDIYIVSHSTIIDKYTVDLPDDLGELPYGLGSVSGHLLQCDSMIAIDASHLWSTVDLTAVFGAFTGSSYLNVNWEERFVDIGTQTDFLGIFKGYSDLFGGMTSSGFVLSASGTVGLYIPDSIPHVGGTELDSANFAVSIKFNDLSNSYIAAWKHIDLWVGSVDLGLIVYFEPDVALICPGFADAPSSSIVLALPLAKFAPAGYETQNVGASQSYQVDPGTQGLILQTSWENPVSGDVPLQIQDPDGAIHNVDPDSLIAITAAEIMDAPLHSDTTRTFYVKNPKPGIWGIIAPNTTGLGNVTFAGYINNPSSIELISPQTDVTGNTVTIGYNANDTDSNAHISLYYDTDREGYNGILLATADPASGLLMENDGAGSYVSDTSSLPTGDYYVYAMMRDGFDGDASTAPVYSDYSLGRIHVVHAGAPVQVSGLDALWAGGDSMQLSWQPVVGAAYYKVSYNPDAAGDGYAQQISTNSTDTNFVVTGLTPGETYRFTVQAINDQQQTGEAAEPVVGVVGFTPTVTPASGEWEVFADPGQSISRTAPSLALEEGQSLVFELASGPAGSHIDPVTGEFTWLVPAAQTGWSTVVIRRVLQEVNTGNGKTDTLRTDVIHRYLLSDSHRSVQITGTLWEDSNGNGVKDTGESGLADCTVFLDFNGNRLLDVDEPMTLTDNQGNYAFTDLAPGIYNIVEVKPSGWTASTPMNAATAVTLHRADPAAVVNFGNLQAAVISGFLFQDLDGNGIKGSSESGLANWTVNLINQATGMTIATTTTALDGGYSFTGLLPGAYNITQTLAEGWTQTLPTVSYTVTLSKGQIVANLAFGNKPDSLHTIKGGVWNDADGDRVWDDAESPLPNWIVWLDLNLNGQRDALEPFKVTDANGEYAFDNLGHGYYAVMDAIVVQWESSSDEKGMQYFELPEEVDTAIVNFGNHLESPHSQRKVAAKAQEEWITGYEDTDLKGRVSASVYDGGPMTYRVVGQPSHGTITLDQQTGDYTYTPESAWKGSDCFAFIAIDEFGISSDPATMNITINPGITVFYVDASVSGGSQFGNSWEDACKDLQSALNRAKPGAQIRVADGVYTPTSTTDRNVSFVLKSGVSISGGYAGFGAPDPDARDIVLYPSVLSGDIGTPDDNTDNSYNVVVGSGVDKTAVLDGFTITAGNADNNAEWPHNCGGGMINSEGNPTLANCTFIENSAAAEGGGMHNYKASPTLSNCTFVGNSAIDASGGGMSNESSSPTLANCIFTGNSADMGGGMYNSSSSSPVLTHCTFTENTAGNAEGGGIYNYSSSPTLLNCTFVRNSATDQGGGICNYSSLLTLTQCTFDGNATLAHGGGISSYNSTLTLMNCLFASNSAADKGGGIFNYYSSPTLTNCTLSANSAFFGGGIYNDHSPSTLANCILHANSAQAGSQIYEYAGKSMITRSDIQGGGFSGTGNINADPLFVRNPGPGPDARWNTSDDDLGDLRLQPNSPCIDAGGNASVPAGLVTDLAGNPRLIDFPGIHDPGAIVDMGAYETLIPLVISGSSLNDTISISLTPDHSTLQVWSGTPTGPATSTYAVATLASCAFDTAKGNDTLVIDLDNGLPAFTLAFTGGNDKDTLILTGFSAGLSLEVLPTQVKIGTWAIGCSGVESTILDGPASSVIELNALTVAAPLSLPAGKAMVLRTHALSITGAGSLDLADNKMILDYASSTPAQTVRVWVANGAIGTTPSITGASTLALMDNSMLHKTSFAGQSLASPFSQILIQAAIPGDANLDGKVNNEDLLAVYANLGKTNATWLQGDLDQNGIVNLSDVAVVQSGLSTPSLTASSIQKTKAPTKQTRPTAKHKTNKVKKRIHK